MQQSSSRLNGVISVFGLITALFAVGIVLSSVLRLPLWAVAVVVAGAAEAGMATVMALILRGLMREDRKVALPAPQH
jgi:hypothetical protein